MRNRAFLPKLFAFHPHFLRLLFLRSALWVALWLCGIAVAQNELPYLVTGPNSTFAQVDFSEINAVDHEIWDQTSIDSGVVSALDMAAPNNAMHHFDDAVSAFKRQEFNETIRDLQKAISIYPKFVSAHIILGLAYLEQGNPLAKSEFETAAGLDDRFPSPFINLGMIALQESDFPAAESNLTKANSLTPGNSRILTALAFAQNADRKYEDAIATVQRMHAREHHGLATAHYIAASAAISLQNIDLAQRELNTFLNEDPANPLAPVARQRLNALSNGGNSNSHPIQAAIDSIPVAAPSIQEEPAVAARILTFPNTAHLHAELNAVADEPEEQSCSPCISLVEPMTPSNAEKHRDVGAASTFATWNSLYTIHQAVDETALLFAVSRHGHMVNDLSLSDIQVLDNSKPPDKILQFIPQSKLPLRLALLIDASDSVKSRTSFEKQAAKKFLRKILNKDSDLAFVAGFNDQITVTQDFTNSTEALDRGIEKLPMDGGSGTAIFDAIFYACWKLAAYPDNGRVAKVLVILTDGEDNFSHRSLRQTIEEAETAGVTVYALNTSEVPEAHTDAGNILKVLSERTGGRAVFPVDMNALDRYFAGLPNVIRSRYLIAYKAADFTPDGKYRTVQVKAGKDGKALRVHVRKGYYARLAATQLSASAMPMGGK